MRISQRKSGVILSYVSEAVMIISGLIYTPIMLRLLGQSEYGLYQLVYSIVSYLSLLSLGFGSSYMRFYSRYKNAEDDSGIAKLNGMFALIFGAISVICILCGAVMILNIEEIFGSGFTAAELEKSRILMGLMVFNMAITFPSSIFNNYVTAHEQFFFQKLLVVIQNIANPFLALPLLILGYGSIGMVCVTTFLTLGRFVVNVWFCFSKLDISFSFRKLPVKLFKEMWAFTFFIFLNQIIDQVNWNVGKFLLGRYVGTVAVAIYGVGAQINTMYLQFSTSISNVFVPKVNEIVASDNDNSKLLKLFTKVGRIQFIIMALILSGFILFGKPFIRLWAGPEYATAYYVTILLIVPVTVPLIQNLGIEIQRAKNMHKVRSVAYFFMAIVNILISIPLVKKFGTIGAASGTTVSLILGNIIFMNWYYHKKIGLNMLSFWKSIAGFIPSVVCAVFTGGAIIKFMEFNNFLQLFLGIVIYSLIYCIFMWLLGMNSDEKKLVSEPVEKVYNTILKKRKK